MKKRLFSLLLMLCMLTQPLFLVKASDLGMPTPDELDGYENVCLTYTFDYYNTYNERGAHTAYDLMPYVAYYDREGQITDYFFDSYLFLPCVSTGPSGASMHASFSNPTVALDWTEYVADTFRDGYNVSALNQAFGTVKEALNDTSDKKAGLFLTILYPTNTSTSFGYLGDRYLDFSKKEDRKYAIKWIIDEQIKEYESGEFENLDLVGFYWLEEYLFNYHLTEEDIELFQYTSEYLHSKGLKLIWIPWYQAYGTDRWQDLGIDVACMQPNMLWMSNPDYDRVEDSIAYSKQYGMCMEMEIDPQVFTNSEYLNRYFIYLEDGMKYGAMDSIKMYYQDKKSAVFFLAAKSKSFSWRIIYDLTYKYAKGALTQEDIDRARNGLYPIDDNLGDINRDSKIDAYDYILCKRIYFDTYQPKMNELTLADVNSDGAVDMYDYILIKRHYFGTYTIK